MEESKIFVCNKCGQVIDEDDAVVIDDEVFCEECAKEAGYVQCDDCGEWCHEDYLEKVGENTYLCPDCLEARRAEENENSETEASAA